MAVVTREKKTTEEIEIEIGSFWKSKSGAIKCYIIDEERAIQVHADGFNIFKLKGSFLLEYFEEHQRISREEFLTEVKAAQRNMLLHTQNL